jgi:hypothetical protein
MAWLFPEYESVRMNAVEYANVIIERILEHGTWNELRWLFDCYGQKHITAWVRQHGLRRLSPWAFSYWREMLGIKRFQLPPWGQVKSVFWDQAR